MALADDLIVDIAAVLDDPDYGRDVTISKATPGTYDHTTGGSTPGVPTTYATRAIIVGYKDYVVFNSAGAIKYGDRRAVVKVKDLAIDPDIGDTLLAGSDKYSIVNRKRIELGGTTIVWVLQLRGLG